MGVLQVVSKKTSITGASSVSAAAIAVQVLCSGKNHPRGTLHKVNSVNTFSSCCRLQHHWQVAASRDELPLATQAAQPVAPP